MKPVVLILVSALAFSAVYAQKKAESANLYTNSAHGSSSYGVLRNPLPGSGYARGNCGHCHEQHASIAGSEPSPSDASPYGTPSNDLLFYDSWKSQTDGFCFMCHTDSSSYQSSVKNNRSYSYRAGGWTSDPVNDIKEAFGLAGSSHNLADIQTFIVSKSPGFTAWKYTSKSNPCVACHNPHAAQGDPANSSDGTKSSGSRGWMLSLPSQHGTKPWPLWGDSAGEKMSDYTGSYQAPYWFNTAIAYEPDNSATTNGSNLTDFVTFCTDCHNSTNTITSTALGTLKTIDWAVNEKHGKGNADGSINMDAPYNVPAMGMVLSCVDCHEPHGSPNAFLIRRTVNGAVLNIPPATDTGRILSFASGNWNYLCDRCHQDDAELLGGSCYNNAYYGIHHDSGTVAEAPYTASLTPCNAAGCHSTDVAWSAPACNTPINQIICTQCHFHGSITNGTTIPTPAAPTPRRTF